MGWVVKMPSSGERWAHYVFLRLASGEVVAKRATAEKGHSVLERQLELFGGSGLATS